MVGEPALLHRSSTRCSPGLPGRVAAAHSVAVGIAFILITFMHVVFGELIPKTMALQTPDGTSPCGWRGR